METVQALSERSTYTSAALAQSKAAYAQVVASIPDIEQSIRETENALSTFLGEAPHAIKRGVLEAQALPEELSAGIPLQLLSNRPDVKAAEMSLASCYYNTNSARAAFYPQITLSGSAGWTNSAGSAFTIRVSYWLRYRFTDSAIVLPWYEYRPSESSESTGRTS